jgi:hypothetical protein
MTSRVVDVTARVPPGAVTQAPPVGRYETTMLVSVDPPFVGEVLVGAVHETFTSPTPATAVTPAMAGGVVAGVVVTTTDVAPNPAEF